MYKYSCKKIEIFRFRNPFVVLIYYKNYPPMGVPRLFKIILEKYVKSHQHVDSQSIQYFFMDFNPIIYSCYHEFVKAQGKKIHTISQATIESGIIENVVKKTRHMICDIVKPTKLVYIAIDGPAPRGKMVQQRHRRYRKILENRYKEQLKFKYEIYEKEPWDTSNITPGTKFMEKLSAALRKASRSAIFSFHGKIDVILSDSNVPGEGEHKFLRYIEGIQSKPDEKLCIFSNDGDLLVLGNRFAKDKDVYILTQPNQTSNIVKELYANDEFMYVVLREFQNGLVEELQIQDFDKERVIYDYVFFTFFGGNDFVKHFPYTMMKEYNTFNLLITIYKMLLQEHKKHLIDFQPKSTLKINTDFLKDFIAELAKREEAGMRSKQNRYNKSAPGKEGQPPNFDELPEWEKEFIQLQNKYYYKEDHPQYQECHKLFQEINYHDLKEKWKERYYQHFFGLDTSNSYVFKQNRKIIALQYVKSLIYTLHYYLDEIPSWTWYYPYRMAPFPSDVQAALHHIKDINVIFRFDRGQPYKPFDQLMLVLPPQNDILPKIYRDLMKCPDLEEFYPMDFELDILAGEKFIYSEPVLPELEDKKITETTKKVEESLSEAERKRNEVRNKVYYIPSKNQKPPK